MATKHPERKYAVDIKSDEPVEWVTGPWDCRKKRTCPCVCSNMCCAPCIWGNAMELAAIGDVCPGLVCLCCPPHLRKEQCIPSCCLACDLWLNAPYSLWMGYRVSRKYNLEFHPAQACAMAFFCGWCYRLQVQHEIMEREGLKYRMDCGISEIVRPDPEEEEEEGANEAKDGGKEAAKKLVPQPVVGKGIPKGAGSGGPANDEMQR